MSLIRQMTKAILTACIPRRRLLVRGPRSTNQRPTLALTFDDGPHPEHTPRLLDRLNDLGLVATFFVIGRNAEDQPEQIRRIAAAEHEIANHTYSHSEPSQTSATVFLDEIRQTDRLLSDMTGRVPATVRPPKGELNWSKLRGLWREQKTVALWNVDPKDYRMTSTTEMNRWSETYEPNDGDVILLHDIHPYAVHAIEGLASRGVFERFETTTIANWLEQPAPRISSLAKAPLK